jgi:hypothetical protein
MNKTLLGILIGLLVGAGGAWLVLHSSTTAEHAKAETAEAKPAEKENPLHLPAAKRDAAGIVLAKPTEAKVTAEVPVFGRVLDVTPLVTLAGELEIARTASAASEKELDRVRKLFAAGANASAQAVETAEATAARDRATIAAARAKLLAAWGKDVAARLELLGKAFAEGATLIRLELLSGENAANAPQVARVSLAGGGETFAAEILGPVSVADPQGQGAGFLALVRQPVLPVGAALRGTLPGPGEAAQALVVPRTSIVYHQGSAWLFVLGEDDIFERKLVKLGPSAPGDSVVVQQGLEMSEQVVVAGAQQLLAAELQAGGAPEPE